YFYIFLSLFLFIFFFNSPSPTEIYTLSLHDALPISRNPNLACSGIVIIPSLALIIPTIIFNKVDFPVPLAPLITNLSAGQSSKRSEEHTSELQSLAYLVCRLLLEKKK